MDYQKSTEVGFSSERTAPPNHYLIKIESFSLLSNALVEEYISEEFDAGGYKWKFILYPNGRKRDGQYISIYLELADLSSFPASWEINITFSLFMFNHIQDKYIVKQDGKIRRYHAMKTMWGIDEWMDLETFRNPQNGYLINDTCAFGAEVFFVQNNFRKDSLTSGNVGKEVVQSNLRGECLSMITEPITYNYVFKVYNYSTLDQPSYKSGTFGFYKWNILLYPNGNIKEGNCKGNYLSIHLSCLWTQVPQNTKLFMKFILRVKAKEKGKDIEKRATTLLASPTITNWGFHKFMSLAELKDSKYGYLVDDSCTIEAEVTLLGLVSNE